MKVIFKINEYFPDTRQISLSMCKSTSRKSIDEHKKTMVNLDHLDYYDSESFVEALLNRSGDKRVKEDNDTETVLPENTSEVIAGDLNIQNIVGKVIEGNVHDYYSRKKSILKMRRVELWKHTIDI